MCNIREIRFRQSFEERLNGKDFIPYASFMWLLQGAVKHEVLRRLLYHTFISHDSWLISIRLPGAVLPFGSLGFSIY